MASLPRNEERCHLFTAQSINIFNVLNVKKVTNHKVLDDRGQKKFDFCLKVKKIKE